MAAITIPDSVKRYFPKALDPTQLWVNYNPKADTLTVYFTDHLVPSVWEDIDRYGAYLRVRGQGQAEQGLKASIDPGESEV